LNYTIAVWPAEKDIRHGFEAAIGFEFRRSQCFTQRHSSRSSIGGKFREVGDESLKSL
jgi:hypothetical protein